MLVRKVPRMRPFDSRIARIGRWILVAGTLAAIAVAAVALGATQRHATVQVPPQEVGSAKAKCRHGQAALAGGFATPGWNPGDSGEGPVIRLISLASGRTVKTTGFNIDDTNTNDLESFAYCGKRARPPKIASADVQVEPNSVGSVVATCPSGSRAIAGGFGTDRLVITLTSKRRGSRSWKVVGFDLEGSKGQVPTATLTAYAYCKAPGAKLVTESKDTTVGQDLSTTNVRCPDGGKALSGGFDGHLSGTGNELEAAGALGSKRIDRGRGWMTSALSTSGSEARITTYAYCRA